MSCCIMSCNVTNHTTYVIDWFVIAKSHVIFWCPINPVYDAMLEWLHKQRTVPL